MLPPSGGDSARSLAGQKPTLAGVSGMSAMGQKPTFSTVLPRSALPPKADVTQPRPGCRLRARSRHADMQTLSGAKAIVSFVAGRLDPLEGCVDDQLVF